MPSPSLVALHGFTGSGYDFAPLWASLGVEGWAPDLPGHGAAAGERPAFDALLDGLHAGRGAAAPGPWVLIGYSLGGRLALHLALRDTADLRALVLIGASPGLATAQERQARVVADAALARHICEIGARRFAAEWAEHPLIASQRRIPSPWGAAMARRRVANDPAGLAWSLQQHGQGALPSLWEALPQLRVPVLLLHGAEDQKFAAIHAQMTARLADARSLAIADAGHAAHLEQPARVADTIERYLSDLGR